MTHLRARLNLRLGSFLLDFDGTIPGRGITAVFGASGSGKTTLLRCLAGLEARAGGSLLRGEETWQRDRPRVFVPPHRRRVGYVFQESSLFPHLGVQGNLEYAMRRARGPGLSLSEAVDWLGLETLLGRATGDLSGGERQRVAIARALLARPGLLLMDEPLSWLDEVGRREVLPRIAEIPSRLSIPVVYVSHSLEEVLRLSDRMIWLVAGRAKRAGTPEEVVRDGGFVRWQGSEAAVVVRATVAEHDEAHHLTRMSSPWGPLYSRRRPGFPGDSVRLQVRAGDVSIALESGSGSSILNEFGMEVRRLFPGGKGEVFVELGRRREEAALLALITSLSADRLGLEPGMRVVARVKSVAVID